MVRADRHVAEHQFLSSRSGSTAYRIGAVTRDGHAFLTIWANVAVGMIGARTIPTIWLFGGVSR